MAPEDELAYKPLVPYSKKDFTPIVQQKDYNITKTEWVALNRKQIVKTIDVLGTGGGVIFKVPKNKVFFLTNIYWYKDGGNANIILGAAFDNFFLTSSTNKITFENTINFQMPLKIVSGQSIALENAGAGSHIVVVIFGYLEDF